MTASAHGIPRDRLFGLLGTVVFACALAVGLLVLTPMVAARASSSQTWTGDGDGSSWGDSMNWSGMSVPANGDSVTIAPTASQPRPSVTGVPGGTELADLTLTNASLSGGAVTLTGDFTWSVSSSFNTLAAPLTVEGDASFSGAGEQDSMDPMTFEGNTNIAGPGLLSIEDSGPAITNSGAMTLEPGAAVRADVCCVSPDVFLNTGTVTVPASTSGMASLAFMRFTDRGSVSVGPGSLLDVSGGPGEFGAGADVTGGGVLRFDQGAAITLAAKVSIAAGTTIALTGNAEFFGPGSLIGSGKFAWSGGTIDGNLDVARTLHTTLSGARTKILMSPGRKHALLAFHGPVSVQDAGPLEAFAADISTSGSFTLKPGATVDAEECCVAPDEFLNTGTITVPASRAGIASVGFLNFVDHGSVSVGPGSVLDVFGGPGQLSAGDHLSGGGTVLFERGAAITLAAGLSIAVATTVVLTGNAEFFGPGGFAGGGKFSWTGGTIDGNLDVASTVHTSISGPAAKNLTSPVRGSTALTLRGATNLQGTGEVELSGATTLRNLGVLTMGPGITVGASVCCVKPDLFANGGTLKVAAGRKTATVTNMAFGNRGTLKINSGTLFVNTLSYRQTAGRTELAGGSLSGAQPVNIAGGTLSGFGTITGSVRNAGTVSPSTTGGVLKISGAYQQTSTGELSSVITGSKPGVKFGQLKVGGTATLAGTLRARTGNGFKPKHRQSFSVLVCHSRSGKFTKKSGQPAFTVTYSSGAARVVYP